MAVSRQQRKRERTRELIQQTALKLFAAHGYRETTISAIAEASDVAVRTVTVHFPAKEDLLLADDPFTAESLARRLAERSPGESTLDALRDWMAETMQRPPEDDERFWQLRALRSRLIVEDEDLRGRARASYYKFERLLAAGIAQDLDLPADALVPRVAAVTVITGLRELYETSEAQPAAGSDDAGELLVLVDRVIDFARAGIAALQHA